MDTVSNRVTARTWSNDIHPADFAPVISGADKGLVLSIKQWGYPLYNNRLLINARSESVLDKPTFKNGIHHHRAVVPAAYFYEWNYAKKKYLFRRSNGRVLYLAGFFDHFNSDQATSLLTDRFIILTTASDVSVACIHDRMPMFLERGEIYNWIMGTNIPEFLKRPYSPLLAISPA